MHELRWYQSNILKSWEMIAHIVLLLSRLPDIIQKCFCTSDRHMDNTFQMKYLPAFFVTREIKQTSKWVFFILDTLWDLVKLLHVLRGVDLKKKINNKKK